MALFRRKAGGDPVDQAIETLIAENAKDQRERRGLENRPRYVAARESILILGDKATPVLLSHLDRLQNAATGSAERDAAYDIIALLGEVHDRRAVPQLAGMLGGIWPTLAHSLAKTDEGTQVLLEAARSPDKYVRADAMGVWCSPYRPAEVVAALMTGLCDSESNVRRQAVTAVSARNCRDEAVIALLRQIRDSDPDEQLRRHADSNLERLGAH